MAIYGAGFVGCHQVLIERKDEKSMYVVNLNGLFRLRNMLILLYFTSVYFEHKIKKKFIMLSDLTKLCATDGMA